MFRVLLAERAVLGNSEPVGVVALIFITVVIAVLALRAFESYFGSYVCFLSHFGKTPYKKITPPFLSAKKVYHTNNMLVNLFLINLIKIKPFHGKNRPYFTPPRYTLKIFLNFFAQTLDKHYYAMYSIRQSGVLLWTVNLKREYWTYAFCTL